MIKEQFLPYFKNKKVTVLGLGLLGRGLGDTEFLLQSGAHVICTDTRSKEKLKESINLLEQKKYTNVKLVIGENRLSDFENRDLILTCAGLPHDYVYLEHAKKNHIPVYMSAALVVDIVMKKLPHVVVIGVTGTRGKTTVTELIAHILRGNSSRVHVGGNIRGVANLPILEDIEDGDFLVLELDSWQLQSFGDTKISPHIAVFTSFLDDHITYYKGDKERYFNDKANIYRNQHDGDILIASKQAGEEIKLRDSKINITIPEKRHFKTTLLGEHNQAACGLAYEVGLQCGLDDESINKAIESFKAVEGRLQYLGDFSGVQVFNDNNATTEDATIASLSSICERYNKKPIVIVGGVDKGLSVQGLEKSLVENAQEIIYLKGTGTDTIKLPKKYLHEKLEDCIREAFTLAKSGDIILFSPAFASYSKYFNNEYERNDLFVKEVQKYGQK